MNISELGQDDVTNILSKSNPTLEQLWRVSNIAIYLAIAGILISLLLLIVAIFVPAIGQKEGIADILPPLSMLLIIAAGLAFFIYCLCVFVTAIILKDYIWAIGIFLFSFLAIMYKKFKSREIRAKNLAAH